jgi:hypothetical protein
MEWDCPEICSSISAWDDREEQLRGVVRIVVNGVFRYLQPAVAIERLSRVWIHIKSWKVAAGDIEPDAVLTLEHQ